VTIVHQSDGQTHDEWWSAMSMAGLLKLLDQFYKSGSATAPVYSSATKHWDGIYVSRYYNWKPGSWKGIYTRVATYKLKPDAPNDALETLSKNLFVPFFEKLLADGTIYEYEIDTEAIHTDNPANFSVVYLTPNAEGLDKVSAALQGIMKANPVGGPAFGLRTSALTKTSWRAPTRRTNKASAPLILCPTLSPFLRRVGRVVFIAPSSLVSGVKHSYSSTTVIFPHSPLG